jgi:hypothetical protein
MAPKGKKAEVKKPTARKVPIRELNDPRRWWRLTKVHRELLPHLGKYVANDLMKELKSGKLRCVQRIETDLKYAKERPPSFWKFLPWPAKPYFARLGTYDPDFYVWRPWEVWRKLADRPEESEPSRGRPERKRAKGGGSKSMYTDEQKEFGMATYREMLRDDPSWRSAAHEAVAMYVQEKAKLLGHWRTAYRNIIEPVNAELE